MAQLNSFNLLAELVENARDGMPAQNNEANPYRILFLEDNRDDVERMQHELNEANVCFTSCMAEKKVEFLKRVFEFRPDVILADYSLSSFNGMQAFQMLRREGVMVPFILVTGALSEQLALECLKDGVDDFILKSSFRRLPAAIINAIKKKGVEKENNRIAFELKRLHEELGLMLERHQLSLEEERRNIARDLHDELGQGLHELKTDITMLCKKLASGKKLPARVIQEEFSSITNRIHQITQSVMGISSGLRPDVLEELGVLEAIRSQAAEFERRNKISCQTYLHVDSLRLNRDLSTALFRIVQETLALVKHSLATQVEIYLEDIDNALFLGIKDNGKEISEEKVNSSKSLGIIGLRERVRFLNGKFDIQRKEREGTMVSVLIPVETKSLAAR